MRRPFSFIDSALAREFVFASNGRTASTDVTGYTLQRGEREVNTMQTKRRLASGISIISVAAALTFATPAGAQAAESTLRGKAAAGSEVVAREVNTGATRRTTASADGTYVIAGLPAGNYHVTAGGQAADVTVPVASVQVLDLAAATTAAGNTIVVTGTRATSEVHTSQVNQFVDSSRYRRASADHAKLP